MKYEEVWDWSFNRNVRHRLSRNAGLVIERDYIMKDRIMESIQDVENDAYRRGLEAGKAESINAQISTMQFVPGDVLVLIGGEQSRHLLESLRRGLAPRGVMGIISVSDVTEIAKLSDVNLALLGLERIKP